MLHFVLILSALCPCGISRNFSERSRAVTTFRNSREEAAINEIYIVLLNNCVIELSTKYPLYVCFSLPVFICTQRRINFQVLSNNYHVMFVHTTDVIGAHCQISIKGIVVTQPLLLNNISLFLISMCVKCKSIHFCGQF